MSLPTPFSANATSLLAARKQVAAPVRVEPKVFFANERTFLSWLHFSILLATLSITLLNFGDRVGRLSGLLLTATAMTSMFYSVYQFLTRAQKIRDRAAGPYDDRIGPVVIAIALCCALVVNMALKFMETK